MFSFVRRNEENQREFLLKGNQLCVILSVALPLVLYNCISLFFSFFDMYAAANMNINVVTTVTFVSELYNNLAVIGTSLSIAAGIMISYSFGEDNREKMKSQISSSFFLLLFIAIGIVAIVIPYSETILRLFHFPRNFISQAADFLSLYSISLIFYFINTIFFATEKARGRTKIVTAGNLLILLIKTALNFFNIFLVNHSIISLKSAMILLAISSIIAHSFFSFYALFRFFSKENPFRIEWRFLHVRKDFIFSLSKLSVPIFLENFALYFGKLLCIFFYSAFGTVGIASFSYAQQLCGLATSPLDAFKEAESTVVASNLGNSNIRRSVTLWFYTCFATCLFALFAFVCVALTSHVLIDFFAKGNEEIAALMTKIYRIERCAFLFDAIDCAAFGFLYAAKKIKYAAFVNVMQLFLVRIPCFVILTRFYGFGIEASAWAILVSNGFDALLSVIFVVYMIQKLRKSECKISANEKLLKAISLLGKWDATDENIVSQYGILVPYEVLAFMRKKNNGTVPDEEMAYAYKVAVIEARIDEIEKLEKNY